MTCDRHSWWFETPCPKCAVTAPVTEATPEPEPAAADGDFPAIPDYLRRNPDNTFVDPTPFPRGEFQPARRPAEPALKRAPDMSDAELHKALSSPMSIADRQPYLMELRRRQDRAKSRERIAKMKAGLDAKKEDEI